MFVPKLLPANGGVMVRCEPDSIEGSPHFHGTVLMAGAGVPWLVPGNRILFATAKATPVEVLTAHLPSLPNEESGGIPADARTTVYLIDQRDVHATIREVDASFALRENGVWVK